VFEGTGQFGSLPSASLLAVEQSEKSGCLVFESWMMLLRDQDQATKGIDPSSYLLHQMMR
jgi:hypothetical protein